MDSPSKLSGETLIVHHIPLVHCQVSGGRQGGCGASLRTSNPFSPPEPLGLSRTTSLPERDVLQREVLLYSSLVRSSCQPGGGGGRGGSTASDDSSYTSSNSEDQPVTAHTLPRTKPRNRDNRLRHNPFLLNTEDDEEEEEEGDNLNGYLEDSSFHLHGNANSDLDDGVPPFHLHDLGFPPEPFLLHGTLGKPWRCTSRESLSGTTSDLSTHLDLLGLDSQRRHGSSGSNMSMDCGEQEWGEDEEDDEEVLRAGGRGSKTGSSSSSCSCRLSRGRRQQTDLSEVSSDCQLGYASDSSCNSSDGVLVSFSAIFNKMNNSVPAKLPPGPSPNLNSSAPHSCPSEQGGGRGSCHGGGAFYLDLHTSPTDPPQPQHAPSSTSPCTCSAQHQGALDLDDNCNSYQQASEQGELASGLQSQARLVLATQNYYKLVTCDLSSQSSPSPAASVTSCSDEHSKDSPTPTEYFLFRHQAEEGGGAREEEQEDHERPSPKRDEEEEEEEEEEEGRAEREVGVASSAPGVIEGQVYVNISPPIGCRADIGGGVSGGHTRSRSYDRSLGQAPPPGSLERMLSCPMRLSEGIGPAPGQATPPRVTSFAEMARCKRRTRTDPAPSSSGPPSSGPPSSSESPPPAEQQDAASSPPSCPLTRCYSQGNNEARETRCRTGGSLSSSPDCCPAVVRYSKDQRPTSLPIQPFTFHHQFSRPQPKPLLPLLTGYVSGMQACSSSGGSGCPEGDEESEVPQDRPRCSGAADMAPPGSVRPSPLGSYSPVRLQGVPSSGSCSTCTPTPPAPLCLSCPRSPQAHTAAPLPPTPPPAPLGVSLPPVQGYQRGVLPSACISPGGAHVSEQSEHSQGPRLHHAHHLSPQALKWREYRRRNPLGVERSGRLDPHRGGGGARGGARGRHARRNVFDFPASSSRFNGPSVKQLQQYYSDYLPDYFSLAERPPEEFCLSPDASSSSSSSSSSEISVDLQQMRGLVKAINTAIDLIVAHFGTSRDPDVKAKLGNSWVSPNVGHLVLKYLCPALRGVLQDGLKPHILDLIIGQRRNQPWSLVEASTQLGPSTRVLHSLVSKVSQYSELTSHSMRLNAFIFGLLNLRSLEFWFNHLHTHEDILAVHYHPWGFLPLSQGPCKPLFQEVLLLLQPLSLLPFHLDFLFEPRLLQKGQDHLRTKELLCSADQSARSTFQLMRGWGTAVVEGEGAESVAGKKKRAEPRREGTFPRMEGVGQGEELAREGGGLDSIEAELGGKQPMVGVEEGMSTLWRERGAGQRVKGVGGESHHDNREGERKKERERSVSEEGRQKQERQAGWWYQLMQSSQVYIDQSAEGSKFARSEKRKKSAERQLSQAPPRREGVVEGAESRAEEEGPRKRSSSCGSAGSRGRRSWMGSPPDSVLSQEKDKLQGPPGAQPSPARPQDQALSQGMRWGRLFGSSPRADDSRPAKTQRSRLPSGWLSLDRSVLELVAQTVGAGSGRRVEPSAPPLDSQAPPPQPQTAQAAETKSPCEVRALCHHIATDPDQLSFHKGDILSVLAQPDSDWLLCSLGASRGLVPLIYVTLCSLGGPNGGPN